MIMNIKVLNKNKTHKIIFQDRHSHNYPPLLSSCPSWILLVSSLWLVQESPLRAMDGDSDRPKKSLQHSPKSEHPLTHTFWKERGLSQRLKNLKPRLDQIKEDIINYKTNLIDLTDEDLTRYKEIFQCLKCDSELSQSLSNMHHNMQLLPSDHIEKITNGRSGNEVIIIRRDKKNLIAIKKFNNIKEGLKELFHSLIALDINPLPQELKMARIYDAVLCPNNCLSIIMEAANSHDIQHCLSTKSREDAENVVKACAEYLATFHIKNYNKVNQIHRKKHIEHASFFFNTLSKNLLDEVAEKETPLLFLAEGREIPDLEKVTSNNIIRLLCPANQEKFIQMANRTCKNFEDNAGKIYRSLSPDLLQGQESYFLTITHGDAHGNNFFYDDDERLTHQGHNIKKDSLHRVTMIDFASIIISYGDIGDPAEDVGRFLGSLWDCAAQQNNTEQEFEEKVYVKMHNLQAKFLETYLQKIEESKIFTEKNQSKIFERNFKENCNFYKLRFYRAVFNSEQDKDIKLKILQSWIKENFDPEEEEFNAHPEKSIKRSLPRKHQTILDGDTDAPDKKYIPHFLPDPVEGFIESAPKESEKSYLEILREKLHRTGVATLSSAVTIAGEGGIGKTSLALEYAHRAYKENHYDLIYWLLSGSDFSLFKGYREFLLELGCPTKDINNTNDDHIITLVNQHIQNKGKCLLIYDNVPDSAFLENKLPENTHILMTSRCNEGWKQQPLMLDVFRLEDSINYFLNITGLVATLENKKIVGELAEQLGHLPLALAHAAHYIRLEGGDKVSAQHFKDYLEGFKKISVEYFEEKKNPFTEEKSKITYENLIARTLRMAEAYISTWQKKPIAELSKKLMGYCAYLESDSLTAELFPEYKTKSAEVKEALQLLSSLSILKTAQNQSLFSMHRLEQLVIRNEHKKNKEGANIPKDLLVSWHKLHNKIKSDKNNSEYPDVFVLYNLLNNWHLHGILLGSHIKSLGDAKVVAEPISLKVYADDLTNKLKLLERETFKALCENPDEEKIIEGIRKRLSLDKKADNYGAIINFIKKLIKKKNFNPAIEALEKIKSDRFIFGNVPLYATELITERMDGDECARIIGSLSRLITEASKSNKLIVKDVLLYAQEFITENMNGYQCASIIRGLTNLANEIPSSELTLDEIANIALHTKSLVNNKITDVESIMSNVSSIDREQRENIVTHTKAYLKDAANAFVLCPKVMNKLKEIKREEREEIISYAKELRSILFSRKIHFAEGIHMLALNEIASVKNKEQREVMIKNAREHLLPGMGELQASVLLHLRPELIHILEDVFSPTAAIPVPIPVKSNKDAVSLSVDMGLANESMSDKAKKKIGQALSSIEGKEEQKNVAGIIQELSNEDPDYFDDEHLPHLINALGKVKRDERRDIIRLSHDLKRNMSAGEYSNFINYLLKIDKNDREYVIGLAKKLINENMSGFECAGIAGAFAAEGFLKIQEKEERNKKRENVLKGVKELASKYVYLDGEELAALIGALSEIKSKETMEYIVSQVKLFMPANIDGHDLSEIIEELINIKVKNQIQTMIYAGKILSDNYTNMYDLQLMGKNPTPDSLNFIKSRILCLYMRDDKLCFKDKYNHREIAINMEDNKVCTFINRESFERLKKSVEENDLPDDEDRKALFNYTSYINYTRRTEELTHLIQSLGHIKEEEEIENIVDLSQFLAIGVKEGKFIISEIIRVLAGVNNREKRKGIKGVQQSIKEIVHQTKKIIQGRNVDIHECTRTIDVLSELKNEDRSKVFDAIEMMSNECTREGMEPINLFIRNIPCDGLIKAVNNTMEPFRDSETENSCNPSKAKKEASCPGSLSSQSFVPPTISLNLEESQRLKRKSEGTLAKTSAKIIKGGDHIFKDDIQNEIDQSTAQGNRYISAAIQHEKEGNWQLAQHLREEADKKYSVAEDIKLAESFYEEEIIVRSLEEQRLSSIETQVERTVPTPAAGQSFIGKGKGEAGTHPS